MNFGQKLNFWPTKKLTFDQKLNFWPKKLTFDQNFTSKHWKQWKYFHYFTTWKFRHALTHLDRNPVMSLFSQTIHSQQRTSVPYRVSIRKVILHNPPYPSLCLQIQNQATILTIHHPVLTLTNRSKDRVWLARKKSTTTHAIKWWKNENPYEGKLSPQSRNIFFVSLQPPPVL